LKNQLFINIVALSLLAIVSACGGGGDAIPVDVTAPDLSVTGVTAVAELASGESTFFSTSVTNQGNADAAGVDLKLTLPSSLSLASLQCSATGGATCPANLGLAMTLSSLPINGRLNFTANVLAAVGSNGPLSWSWGANGGQDTTATNNLVSSTQSVYSHNVEVLIKAPTEIIAAGSSTDFEVKVVNTGPSTAKDVSLTMTPDSALTLSTVTCTASVTASCPSNLNGTISIAQLVSGAELTFKVTTNVVSGSNGVAVLSAQVQAKGDSSATNNTSRGNTTVYSANLNASLARLTAEESQELLTAPTDAGHIAYRATIFNAGPSEAKAVSVSLSQGTSATTWISCKAVGGAVCPNLTTTPVVIPTIVTGGSLFFLGKTNIPLSNTGSETANLTVTSAGDPVATNNTSSVTTTADSRNGTYSAFGFNGQRYDIDVNLNSGVWLVKSGTSLVASGYARDVDGRFIADSVVSVFPNFTSKGFKIANGVLVGSFELPRLTIGSAPVGLVASKTFVTSLADLTGTLNFFSSTISNVNESTESSITTGEFRNLGTQFFQCVDAVITVPISCPVGSSRTYALTLVGTDITGTNIADSTDVIRFRVARTNGSLVYLRAGTLPNLDKRFTIGMVADASFPSSAITFSVTNRFTVHAGTVSPALVRLTEQVSFFVQYEAVLFPLTGAANPPSIRGSSSMTTNTSGDYVGQSIFVMQGPLYAAIGVRGGGIAGRIEVGLLQ
jgi:Domain of unknown function DUF11